jgi:hypothetical protein
MMACSSDADTTHIRIDLYDNSQLDSISFAEWFGRYRMPSGRRAEPDSMNALCELCNKCNAVGMMHTPSESAIASNVGYVLVGAVADNGDDAIVHNGMTIKCYAAARLCTQSNTLVIDLLCVHDTIRKSGVGRAFYDGAMAILEPKISEHVGKSTAYLVTVQAVFDYASYTSALVSSCAKESETDKCVTLKIRKDDVMDRLTGPCRFWKKLGFDGRRLEFGNEKMGIYDPVLVMWREYMTVCS